MNIRNKKTGFGKLFAAALVVLGAATVSQSVLAQTTGIRASKHNLSNSSTTGNNKLTGFEEICVFCHTPHAASTNAVAPLWNKQLATSVAYKTYSSTNSSTMDGTVAITGGVSMACLSCHDGTQAMDTVINAPGSGLGSGRLSTGTNSWSGTNVVNGTSTTANSGKLNGGIALLVEQGVAGNPDLTNDHPVGIPYCGGGYSAGKTVAADCKDKDFFTPSTSQIQGTDVFWLNTTMAGSTNNREKSDIILYTRSGVPYVECASCHDPHRKETTTLTFLRTDTNNGSQICLACHNK